MTFALVGSLTCSEPLITRETVWWETPASRATSEITARLGPRFCTLTRRTVAAADQECERSQFGSVGDVEDLPVGDAQLDRSARHDTGAEGHVALDHEPLAR